jgi:ferredoxin-thioredoxin reductase catalytic subunit
MKHGTDTIPEDVVKDLLKETKAYGVSYCPLYFSDDNVAQSSLAQ